jgi:hypothetical protein
MGPALSVCCDNHFLSDSHHDPGVQLSAQELSGALCMKESMCCLALLSTHEA